MAEHVWKSIWAATVVDSETPMLPGAKFCRKAAESQRFETVLFPRPCTPVTHGGVRGRGPPEYSVESRGRQPSKGREGGWEAGAPQNQVWVWGAASQGGRGGDARPAYEFMGFGAMAVTKHMDW